MSVICFVVLHQLQLGHLGVLPLHAGLEPPDSLGLLRGLVHAENLVPALVLAVQVHPDGDGHHG